MITHPQRWLTGSVVTIVVSVLVIVGLRPQWGIDFIGGSLLEYSGDPDAISAIRTVLSSEFSITATVQATTDETILIRTPALDEERHNAVAEALQGQALVGEELRFESIGPTIGAELRRKSFSAGGLVVISIIAYLAYAFRGAAGLMSPWKFGVAASYALLHDLLFITALFVIFGRIWQVPIDTLFVTAMLAIMGYSVNDTIVLFNRLKTDWIATRSGNLSAILDRAVRSVMVRTINTTVTTLLVLISLLIFGGTTIHWFVVALTIGTVVGSYSSLFVAAPALFFLAKRVRP